MTPYISLSLILIAAGLALLAAVGYLARLVRRHRRAIGSLLRLAKQGLEPLELPAAAWPALAAGGIMRLEYSGLWFAQSVRGEFGHKAAQNAPFCFTVAANDDVRLEFRLHASAARGEARLFAENLAGVFRLLLETSVQSRMEALSAALTEQARLTLYLQHDLRNLAQWVQWLAADLASAADDAALLDIARPLQTGAPHAAARARRILDATRKRAAAPENLALAACIRIAAEHAGVCVEIAGESTVRLRRDLLDRTLDNLFANVAPLLRPHAEQRIGVDIAQRAGFALATVSMPRLPGTADPKKLFEPFSSGRPGGLGLGLYQAHRSLLEAGGELAAEVCEQHVCFYLKLPAASV